MSDETKRPRHWTPEELRKANHHPWVHRGVQPDALRDIRKVLADAEPDLDRGLYQWHAGGDEWWGVVPPAGILPMEIIRAMPVRTFNRRRDAMQALREAASQADPTIPNVEPYTLHMTDATGRIRGTAQRVFWWCHFNSGIGAVWLDKYGVYTAEEKHVSLVRIRRTGGGVARQLDEVLADGEDKAEVAKWLEEVAEVVTRDGSN